MINRLARLRWFLRWPLKWAIFGLTVFLVSFPNPWLFARHVRHWQAPDAMIDPDLPALQPWIGEVSLKLKPEMPPRKALKTVEAFVYQKVPYVYDWDNWGQADYLPTAEEVLKKGGEDCDGRAVVAASILRKLGYRAELVSDLAHVWVKTDRGDTMGPGKRRSITVGKDGAQVQWLTFTQTLPRALAYSIAPFPLLRELIVLLVLWALLLHPRLGWRLRLLGLALMLEGLLFLRVGGANWRHPVTWAQWWGLAHLLGAIIMLWVAQRRSNHQPSDGNAPVPLDRFS